jgi:hypothetical protein
MKTFFFSCAAVALIGLTGCYGYQKSQAYTPAYGGGSSSSKASNYSDLNEDNVTKRLEAGNVNMKNDDVSRKILYSGSITLLVKNPDTTAAQVGRIAKEFEGYVSESGTSKVVIRVKSQHFTTAMKALEPLGKVDYKRTSGQDVTDDYLDMIIRLENAMHARDRYLKLLEAAENVEAALKVEKELERLNGVIDQLKGRMARMDHLETYSTITVTIKERVKPGLLGYIGMGLWKGFKWLFVRN